MSVELVEACFQESSVTLVEPYRTRYISLTNTRHDSDTSRTFLFLLIEPQNSAPENHWVLRIFLFSGDVLMFFTFFCSWCFFFLIISSFHAKNKEPDLHIPPSPWKPSGDWVYCFTWLQRSCCDWPAAGGPMASPVLSQHPLLHCPTLSRGGWWGGLIF